MASSFKNHSEQGNIGLGKAISFFTSRKITVSLPLNDCQKYDIVVDIDDTLNRVFVRTTRYKSKKGDYKLNLRTLSGGKNLGWCCECSDIVFILTGDGSMYLIPSKELCSYKNAVTLNEQWSEYLVKELDIDYYIN